VKLGKLVDPNFKLALEELTNQPVPIEVSYQLATLSDTFDIEFKKFEELRQTIIEKHVIKEEDGSYRVDESGQTYVMSDPAGFDLEYKRLCALDVEVMTLTIKELDGVKISAKSMALLKDIVKSGK